MRIPTNYSCRGGGVYRALVSSASLLIEDPDQQAVNRHLVQLLSLVLLVVTVEAMLYPSQTIVPSGVFAVPITAFDVRALDLLVLVLGLFGLVSPKIAVNGAYLYVVLLSATYTGLMAFIGILDDVPYGVIITQSRFIIYLLILLPLSQSMRVTDLYVAAYKVLKILCLPLVAVALLSVLNRQIEVPFFHKSTLGAIGGDLGSIVVLLALLSMAHHVRHGHVTWQALWIFFPLLGAQRASIVVGCTVGVVAVLYAVIISNKSRSTQNRRSMEIAVIMSSLLLAVTTFTVLIAGPVQIWNKFQNFYDENFNSVGRVASAETRPYQLVEAWERFLEAPLFGGGLGNGVTFYDVFNDVIVPTESAHNSVADILLRGGLLGGLLALMLFVVATRGHLKFEPDHFVLVLALISLFGKSLLEPAFDKYRLAFLIALIVTAMASNQSSIRQNKSDRIKHLVTGANVVKLQSKLGGINE
jgi:hypothetical protein